MKRTLRELVSADMDMTSMLDVVFILLIFFVVTTTFSRSYSLNIERPSAQVSSVSEARNLQIRIDEQNRVWVQGRVIATSQLAVNIAKEAAIMPFKLVQLQAHEGSTHKTLVRVLNDIKAMGHWPVILAN
ncbi:ExbD/TolR family protein [Pseudoalteromonas sp. SSDWG2]|uniref:ExbD/TolR family protein n=1 Tax=Pseudoalteromonas sp. SSDWG2 TaxID=3139391 RepID=UPI003BACA0A1